MKDKYVDSNGNTQQAKLEAFCVKAKEYLNGQLLDGDRCSSDSDCYVR